MLVKYYIVQGLNVQAGPQVGFVVGAKGDVYNTKTNHVVNQSITGLLKSSDFALSLGIGYDLPMGLIVNARYNLGLTDISKYSGNMLPSGIIPFGGWAPMGTVPAKNQVVQLSVGYRLKSFGLK